MNTFYVPYVEILWKKFPGSLKNIKVAGFDGIECHLIGGLRSRQRIKKLRDEADQLGLKIRFHQGWTWETGQRNMINRILRPLGQLVPIGQSLNDQVYGAGNDPVVVYGNHVDSFFRSPNYLYQTASEHLRGLDYAMSFENFLSSAKFTSASLVFDTQHVLEWSENTHNVSGLTTKTDLLTTTIQSLWDKVHRQVKEIHLCDFDPRRGPSHGRNVPLGEGVFPLSEFAKMVNASKWSGVITPEVNPSYLKGGLSGLTQLKTQVANLFA